MITAWNQFKLSMQRWCRCTGRRCLLACLIYARLHMQGVHSMFEGMPGRLWKDGEPRTSRMVFIGRDIDEELIKEGFQQCLLKQPSIAR